MLSEFALIPDIFNEQAYTVPELFPHCLGSLRKPLMEEAIVRDLHDGDWQKLLLTTDTYRSKPLVKELLRKLVVNGRLRSFRPMLGTLPSNDAEWCEEAVQGHGAEPLRGIICGGAVAAGYRGNNAVACIEKLSGTEWWRERGPSIRLIRNTAEYLKHLNLILNHGRSLIFIDPHINPVRGNYSEFGELLGAAGGNPAVPRIEIHRVCYIGAGPDRQILDPKDIERDFRAGLAAAIQTYGLSVEVFIWDDFHDRYLLSNLIGILVPNGFDVTTNPDATTTWSRLSRADCESVVREFAPNYRKHHLRHRFTIS